MLLPAFEISRYPITNLEYCHFVDDAGYRPPASWVEGYFPLEKSEHPVVGISGKNADDYCKWLSEKTGDFYRLPLIWELEIAAGGSTLQKYPWGDEFDSDKCNTGESKIGDTTPVGIYFDVKSVMGLQDAFGNVCEITIIPSFWTPFFYFLAVLFMGILYSGFIYFFQLFKELMPYWGALWGSDWMKVFLFLLIFANIYFVTIEVAFIRKIINKIRWLMINRRTKHKGLDIKSADFAVLGCSWRLSGATTSIYYQTMKVRRDDVGFRVVRQNRNTQ
jgi:hypothetical protein